EYGIARNTLQRPDPRGWRGVRDMGRAATMEWLASIHPSAIRHSRHAHRDSRLRAIRSPFREHRGVQAALGVSGSADQPGEQLNLAPAAGASWLIPGRDVR